MGHTRGIRLDAREHSAEVAAADWQPLDDIDREILDWVYGFPARGPHYEQVGISLDEYKARVYALLENPVAELWAPESVFRLRSRYGSPKPPRPKSASGTACSRLGRSDSG